MVALCWCGVYSLAKMYQTILAGLKQYYLLKAEFEIFFVMHIGSDRIRENESENRKIKVNICVCGENKCEKKD